MAATGAVSAFLMKGFSALFGFVMLKGDSVDAAFWAASAMSLPLDDESLRVGSCFSFPDCHMNRRSCHVGDDIVTLVSSNGEVGLM